MDEGVSDTTTTIPVPDKLAVCGLLLALSNTPKVALRAPAAAGVKVALNVHEAPTATAEPQLFV